MIRPLYLGPAARRVALDGPALLVRATDEPDSRVPLRLVSRIVSRANVAWSADALGGCMHRRIPLVFVEADGHTLGYLLPATRREDDLARLLDQLDASPDGTDRFADWAAAEERRAILAMVGRVPVGQVDLRPARVRRAVAAATGLGEDRAGAMWLRLEAALAAHLSDLLLGAGLPAVRAAPASPGSVDIHGAFLAAARWEVVPALRRAAAHRLAHPRAWSDPRRRHRRTARQYEAEAPRIAALFRRRLHRLHTWLGRSTR